eukprot:8960322-Heterocapsa_arctica.AAC.1
MAKKEVKKGDREVVMAADKSNGEALRYASEKQKVDREVQQFYIGEEHEQSAGHQDNEHQERDKEVQEDEPGHQECHPYE